MYSVGEMTNMEICYALWFSKLSVLKNSIGDLVTTAVLLKYNGYMLIVLISDQFPDRNNLKEGGFIFCSWFEGMWSIVVGKDMVAGGCQVLEGGTLWWLVALPEKSKTENSTRSRASLESLKSTYVLHKQQGPVSQRRVKDSKTPRVAKFKILTAQPVKSGEGQHGV